MDTLRDWNERQGTVSALEFIFFMVISTLVGFLVGICLVLVFS